MKKIWLWSAVVLLMVGLSAGSWAGSKKQPVPPDSSLSGQSVYWYENGVKKAAWMALDEMAVFPAKGGARVDGLALAERFSSEAEVTEQNESVVFLKAPAPMAQGEYLEKLDSLRGFAGVGQSGPVFYTSRTKRPGGRIAPTGGIIVQYRDGTAGGEIAAVEEKYGLTRIKPLAFARNTFLYQTGDPLSSIGTANELYESGRVNSASPNWLRKRIKRATPDDTLYSNQWHLDNTGQGGGTAGIDINVNGVWDTYTGTTGEVIAIVDDGLEIGHPDLTTNTTSGGHWDWVGNDNNPSPGPGDDHGTACGGVAAGRGFNGQGISGAAPQARLIGYRLLGNDTDVTEGEALSEHYNDVIDVSSNSWGPADDAAVLEGPLTAAEAAILYGVTSGRGGLGSIYIWAGGNGLQSDDNSNYDGYANSRYTIAVAASTNYGEQSYYSEPGANILVTAPSNGGSRSITTTDRTDVDGYNTSTTANGGDYTSTFGGTSSACPLVAGVVALMLDANPDLTWREVQVILAGTAARCDPTDSDWTQNGAGLYVNHKFGFGRVNAGVAVAVAEDLARRGNTGRVLGAATSIDSGTLAVNTAIPDNNSTGVTATFNTGTDITVEFVDIYFTSDHTYWGDLEIVLTSPDGTQSVLAEEHVNGAEDEYSDGWRFGSVRHLGESSAGNWTLTVRDRYADDTGDFESWQLVIHGSDGSITDYVRSGGVDTVPDDDDDDDGDTGGSDGGGGGGCFLKTLFGGR